MKSLDTVKQSTWDLIYERSHRNLINSAKKRQPYAQAMTWETRMKHKKAHLFEEKLAVYETLKREELNGMNKKIFSERFIESIVMGNLTRSDTKVLFESFLSELNSFAPSSDFQIKWPEEIIASSDVLYQNPGTHFAIRVEGTNPEELNGACIYQLQVPPGPGPEEEDGTTDTDTLWNWLQLALYNQIVSQKCFDVLRTKEQLGYIVWSQPWRSTGQKQSYLYIVQSEVAPWKVKRRIEAFIEEM